MQRVLSSRLLSSVLIIAMYLLCPSISNAARLKDIADVEGVRGNQLYGYGLVVGLNGTGDGSGVDFTVKSLSNMLENMGVRISPDDIKVKNVAAVMVTAELPPFTRPGAKLDIQLLSIGDAKSLLGGTLVFTPLKGADGNVYAVAQGPVTVGGFSVSAGGDTALENHPTAGFIASGATIERTIPFDLFQSQRIRIVLHEADFTTMTRLVSSINEELQAPIAVAVDGASVEVPIGGPYAKDPIGLLARLEQIDVNPDTRARVVVNERTGTIVMGETVSVDRVALAHGNLNISIRSETQVSQPNALGEGQTAVVNNQDITVGEEVNQLGVVGGKVTLQEIVDALNSLGATPRDLISIFMALKKAGALNAEIVVM